MWHHGLCHCSCHPATKELALLKQPGVKPKPFQTDQFHPPTPPRKCSFPIKPESNYLGLASDQKGLLSSIVFKTLWAGRIMTRHRVAAPVLGCRGGQPPHTPHGGVLGVLGQRWDNPGCSDVCPLPRCALAKGKSGLCRCFCTMVCTAAAAASRGAEGRGMRGYPQRGGFALRPIPAVWNPHPGDPRALVSNSWAHHARCLSFPSAAGVVGSPLGCPWEHPPNHTI